MRLYNNSSYRYTVNINGNEYDFDKKAVLDVNCGGTVAVTLKCLNKSSVHLNWIDIILGVFFGDSTTTMLYCDYSFQINNSENAVINIKNNNWHPREQLGIHACYADVEVNNEEYYINGFSKIERKHRNLHLFVSSLLPVGIILLILCFFLTPSIPFILLFALWLFIYGIPSIKEIKRFQEATERNYLNAKLRHNSAEYRHNGTNCDETTSKTGKLLNRLLDKIFKFVRRNR